MALADPITDLDPRFSSPGAKVVPWSKALRQLRDAEVLWLSTVTPEGRPHVVPLIAVWLDGALYFSTGEGERKARNLRSNTHVTIATGPEALSEALDIVLEGEARVVSDAAKIRRIAKAYVAKYGEGWRLPGIDGVLTFEVTPSTAFGFGRRDGHIGLPSGEGEMFTQTRWRFATRDGRRPR
jgi:nitroimidazol reductase NimA-like FMN-containing flavoprotein (pyridoxamine 5'-phosphate oxidase superfamily)